MDKQDQDLQERLIINKTILNNFLLDSCSNKLENTCNIKNHSAYQKPLDLYMVCTNQDNQNGYLQPLNVYTQNINPKIDYHTNGDAYYHYFDESSYKQPKNLRRIDESDGLIGYYSKRRLENVVQMLVCVTMYSEDRNFLEQTLLHIQNNLQGFNELGVQDFQIVVAVMYDGIMKAKEEVVDFYLELEREQNFDANRNIKIRRETIQTQIDFLDYSNQNYLLDANEGLPPSIPKEISLLYQNRMQLYLEDKNNRDSTVNIVCPKDKEFNQNSSTLTVLSVFKHKNAKKLSSHLWFFEGLCRQIRPKYVAFVDVGTLPSRYGLVQFYKSMEGNDLLGGVCGFLGLEEPPQAEIQEGIDQKTKYIDTYLRQKRQNEQTDWEMEFQKKKQLKKELKNKTKIFSAEEIESFYQTHNSNFLNLEQQKQFNKKFIQSNLILWILLFPYYLLKFLNTYFFKKLINCIGSLFASFLENFLQIFSSLRLAQVYEYATGHIIDKNFDSLSGYLHVLPGAWSAYRYNAIEVKEFEQSNFMQDSYFKSVLNPELLTDDIKEANKFLAEDRILCLGILSSKKSRYQLKYIPDAYAVTDSPETLEEFVHQRRRWNNSMIFALLHVLKHYKESIKESDHSTWFKKVRLPINMFFAKIGLFNTIFIPAFFLFIIIVSGFQFQIPRIKYGKEYIEQNDNKNKCQAYYELKESERMCDSQLKVDCYGDCSINKLTVLGRVYNIFMQVFPFLVVATMILFVMASLTIKMKKQNFQEYLSLFNLVINQDDRNEIENFKQKLVSKKLSPKEVEIKTNQLIQNLGEKRLQQLQPLMNSKKLHKLPKEILKIKNEYDRLNSLLIMLVSVALYFNIFAPEVFKELGFNLLPNWMRQYVIYMLIINTGFFIFIMFLHLLFQPMLVWLIIKSYLSYLLYSPVYLIFLSIFSFCNIDDVTWGTKGLQNSTQNQIFVSEKVRFVKYWMWINVAFLLALLCGTLIPLDKTPYVIIGTGIYSTLYNVIRIFGASINYLKYYSFDKFKANKKLKIIKNHNFEQYDQIKSDFYDTMSNINTITSEIQEYNESYKVNDQQDIINSRMISREYEHNKNIQIGEPELRNIIES